MTGFWAGFAWATRGLLSLSALLACWWFVSVRLRKSWRPIWAYAVGFIVSQVPSSAIDLVGSWVLNAYRVRQYDNDAVYLIGKLAAALVWFCLVMLYVWWKEPLWIENRREPRGTDRPL